MSKIISLEEAKRSKPFPGSPEVHPFAGIVEKYLRSVGIDPDDVKRGLPGEAVWSFRTDSGLSAAYRLYKTPKGEMFFHLETAFGRVPEGGEDLIALAMLQLQYGHYYPLWFSLNQDRLAVLLCRAYCDGIMPEHFLLRLDSMLTYGAHVKELFSKPEYGLQPLPASWFAGTKAS